jgi:hypothetical protein
MSVSQTSNAANGVQGQKYHMKSLSDKIKDMESAITTGLKGGTLTTDQATAMGKALDSIKSEIAKNQNSSTGYLSPDETKKIRGELQSVGKQLYTAVSSATQATQATSSNDISDVLGALQNNTSSTTTDYSTFLKAIQTAQKSGDKTKVNSELKLFLAQMQMNTLYNTQGNVDSSSNSTQNLFSLLS